MNNDATSQKTAAARLVHRLKHDRGAVLVEAAIAIPLLLLVILGSVEAGLGWEAKSSTVAGVRTGVLRASTISDRPDTDLRVLQSIIGEVGADNVDRIEWIALFDASDDPDAKFQACANDLGGFDGCVVYDQAIVNEIATSTDPATLLARFDPGTGLNEAAGTYTCTGIDANWCAGSRTIDGDVQLGVAVSYKHEWVTGIFPFESPTFQEYVISSTFAVGGANIDSGAPGALPYVDPVGVITILPEHTFDSFPISPDISISGAPITESPSGENFLGPLPAGTITVNVRNTESEPRNICVEFDLLIIGTWDSNSNRWGPDYFSVDFNGEEVLAPRTFTQDDAPGADPDKENHLGMRSNQSIPLQACGLVAPGETVSISFNGDLVQNNSDENPRNPNRSAWDEAFGIDNLSISNTP